MGGDYVRSPIKTENERSSGLILRVFRVKLRELIVDIMKEHVLGRQQPHVDTIEFQKRGLHQALIILTDQDKPRDPIEYDKNCLC